MSGFDFSPADIIVVSKDWVFSRVSEKEVMDFYLGRSYDYGEMFRSPFRRDRTPTCHVFVSNRNRPMFRDFAEDKPIDCIEVAQRSTGIWGFYPILRKITEDLGLAGRQERTTLQIQEEQDELREKARAQKAHIQIKIQPWQRVDRQYLEKYGLNDTDLLEQFKVYSPEVVWLHGERYYYWNERDPALAYFFGTAKDGSERWKIYFYKRRTSPRFIGNTSRIQGWVQLPERGNVCVMTKSLKDVMCLSLFNIPAIAMQGEMTLPYPRIVDELKDRFANLYSLYDFDWTGVRAAKKLRDEFAIEPLFLTNGRFGTRDFGSKDFSDFVRDHSEEEVKALLREAVLHTGVKLTLPFEDGNPTTGDRNTKVHHSRYSFEEEASGLLQEGDEESSEEVPGVPF